MTKDEDFKLLKIQTCVLRVSIHCDGCKQKVKKLLRRTEGVYSVSVDAEQQKATVSGSVDSTTLIKKLERAGKHAELWTQKSNQNQNQNQNQKQKSNNNGGNSSVKDNNKQKNQGQRQEQQQQKQNNQIKGIEGFGNLQKYSSLGSEEYDSLFDEDEEAGLRVLQEQANQYNLNLLRHHQLQAALNEANNAKKHAGNGINEGKKGNQHPNAGVQGNSGTFDPNAMAAAMKMGINGNDINAPASLSNNAVAPANLNNFSGFQLQPNNGMATGIGHHPASSMMMNMNGADFSNINMNHPSQAMMLNRMMGMHHLHQQQQQQQQQPQIMYQRIPYIPPSTGYYYNYNVAPHSYTTTPASHMFSDDNTSSSCSIM
ncbi:hypothetical protein RND81_07G033700 [Saponaria officinalis]|uniref:HMA domain-containing protein n=1 Tax=Saponaria officinalis TaxID=3572 RepID=A0AAW1JQT4_SAPOF